MRMMRRRAVGAMIHLYIHEDHEAAPFLRYSSIVSPFYPYWVKGKAPVYSEINLLPSLLELASHRVPHVCTTAGGLSASR